MTAFDRAWSDAALTVTGRSPTRNPGVKITPVSVGTGGARVPGHVSRRRDLHAHGARGDVCSPAARCGRPAAAASSFTVQAQNRDGCGCAPTAFERRRGRAHGWGASVARTSSIAPGAITTTSIAVTPAQAAQVAFYPLTINARNVASPTLVATAASTVAIQSTTTTTISSSSSAAAADRDGTIAAAVSPGSSSYRRSFLRFGRGADRHDPSRATAPAVAGATVKRRGARSARPRGHRDRPRPGCERHPRRSRTRSR
jgi:hypothetical protein